MAIYLKISVCPKILFPRLSEKKENLKISSFLSENLFGYSIFECRSIIQNFLDNRGKKKSGQMPKNSIFYSSILCNFKIATLL